MQNTCMSTKTIAVETSVYQKLAAAKGESESFTRTIDRLLASGAMRGTCAEAVESARAVWGAPLTPGEAQRMEEVLDGNREQAARKRDI